MEKSYLPEGTKTGEISAFFKGNETDRPDAFTRLTVTRDKETNELLKALISDPFLRGGFTTTLAIEGDKAKIYMGKGFPDPYSNGKLIQELDDSKALEDFIGKFFKEVEELFENGEMSHRDH